MKINLAGAGRRISFIQRLQAAGFNVKCYEIDLKCPATHFCDVVDGSCTVYDNNTFVLPLMDRIAWHHYMPCPENVWNICFDKRKFESWMIENFHHLYPIHLDTDLIQPKDYQAAVDYIHKIIDEGIKANICAGHISAIAKPRYGNSSKGLINIDPLQNNLYLPKDYVLQRKIFGTEYSVDAYFNKEKKMVSAVPRKRINVIGGEVEHSITVDFEDLVTWTREIGEKLGIAGPSCFQFMVEEDTGNIYCFEINARFGGGCILSLEAGWNVFDWIKHEYYGLDKPSESKIQWGLRMRRYNQEIFTKE